MLRPEGLSRWPVAPDPNDASTFVVGPPERLPLPLGNHIAQSQDGSVIATCDRTAGAQVPHAGVWVWRTDRPGRPLHFASGADVARVAVSPDGRWVATLNHASWEASVWDAENGELVHHLPGWGSGIPRFTEDGRWLLTVGPGGQLFSTETWEPIRSHNLNLVPAPDGRLAAVAEIAGIRLIDLTTFESIGLLRGPSPSEHLKLSFTPDGDGVIAIDAKRGVEVWNLRLIRKTLKEMHLDWRWTGFPTARSTATTTHAPLKVRWIDGDP